MSQKDLFTPVQVGPYNLKNRIVMAPMTRNRAGAGNVPGQLQATYYRQRASAGLLITEATQVTPEGQGYPNTPGIHSKEQVEGWKLTTKAVHEAGGKIFLQLWHVGRISHSLYQPNKQLPVAPSPVPMEGELYTPEGMKPYETPRPLELKEIPQVVEQFRRGAQLALEAGFDGVEVHGANGYLIDQFLQDGTNKRTDEYGGAVANRARFLLEVMRAVISVWGASRVGVRLSPNGSFHNMKDSNPKETFSYAIRELDHFGLAYLHLRTGTRSDIRHGREAVPIEAFRPLFKGPLMLNDQFDKAKGDAAIASGIADLIAFGTPFISNPDLPRRFQTGAALNPVDTKTMYGGNEHGYTDYPALEAVGK
ncbi:MAG: alkene reductase [Elusimicrobia bacterium]|nr:alkene reductase [Elusimicrobiota bacterium]